MEELEEKITLKSISGEALYEHIENTDESERVSSKCIFAR